MFPVKAAFFFIALLFATMTLFSQDYRANPGHRFSKEEMSELMLETSRQKKSKGFLALASGSVMTGVGLYLVNK